MEVVVIRRRLTSTLSGVLGVLALIAGSQAFAQNAPTEITYWHVWGGARLPMVEQMISDFEALHPDITVEHTLLDQGDMAARYLTAIAAGDPPDVMMMHSGRFFPTFANRGVLLDLGPYLERDGMDVNEIFYGSDVSNYTWNGKVYGLPVSTDNGGWNFFYDVDAFVEAGLDPNKPPTTWQELEEYAAALTVRENGKITRLGFSPASTENYAFKEWLYLNNGQFISDDGRQILFNSDEGLTTLSWMVGFYDRLYGGFNNVLALVGEPSVSGRNIKGNWYNGLVAMHVDGVWHLAQLAENAPDKNVRASLMPYNGDNPDARVRNVGGIGWAYSIPVGSSNPDAAWEFVKYTTAGEGNLNFFLAQGRPTPVIAFNDDPRFAEGNPYLDAFLANAAATDGIVNSPVQDEIDRIVMEMTEAALLGKMTPQAALEKGAKDAQAALDEFWSNQ